MKIKDETPQPIFGLALSGGGARGFAHIGVLEALEENNIFPDIVAGVSSGSIVGGLYCMGKTPSQIKTLFKEIKVLQLLSPRLSTESFFEENKLKLMLKAIFGDTEIQDLKTPLLVVATNLLKGNYRIFNQGPLWKAVLASCSIPVIFPPIIIDDEPFIDGGVLKNFPVTILKDQCEFVIGSNVNPSLNANMEYKDHIIAIAERVYKLIVRSNAQVDIDSCDLLIEPKDLNNFSIFNTKKKHEIISLGYQKTIEMLSENPEWKNYLQA